MGAFHQGLFLPIGPIWTRLSPINICFDRHDCRHESPRKSDWLPFFNMLKNSSRSKTVVLVVRGSGEGRVLPLRRHYAQPPVESDRGYTKAPEGGRDKGTFRGPSDEQDKYEFTPGKEIPITATKPNHTM